MPADPRAEALTALIRHLDGERRSGVDRIWLTEQARRDLLTIRERNHSAEPPAPENTYPPAEPGESAPSKQFSRIRESLGGEEAPPAKPTQSRAGNEVGTGPGVESDARNIAPAKATGNSKRERLDSLIDQAKSCPRCAELGTFRETMVFATGDPDADIMFVGEAPGAEEEVKGEPFVGPAGQLLTKIIGVMGLERSEVYISNICKFRPRLPNQTSNNRKPTNEEMDVCLPYILSEVDIIGPKVIVALGGTAMEGLLGTTMSVARAREGIHDFRGIPLIVTYHPSYLLRNTGVSERRKVWEDMMRAMEVVGLPISEKQRNFFRGK